MRCVSFGVNRGKFKDTDVVELVVSPSTLEMNVVGTETSISANGKQQGVARLPSKVFVKVVGMAKTYHKRERTILIDDGWAKVGRTKISQRDIAVGNGAHHSLSIPPNASVLDTLAVGPLVTPKQIADAGLHDRGENAQKRASAAVGLALSAAERVQGHLGRVSRD